MNKSRFSFTLSEVLISITIIGIIAAITIPAIINKYNRTIIETRLKQTYSTLANMFKLAEADYGSIDNWDYGELTKQISTGAEVRDPFVKKYMLPYLKYQDYKTKTWSEFGYKNGLVAPKGLIYRQPNDTTYALTLANGAFIAFDIRGQQLTNNKYAPYQMFFITDINGPLTGPNIVGKDIFYFVQYFTKMPLLMPGEYSSNYYWYRDWYDIDNDQNAKNYPILSNKDTGEIKYRIDLRQKREKTMENCATGEGYATECGALIKSNGWKIPKDYPWL